MRREAERPVPLEPMRVKGKEDVTNELDVLAAECPRNGRPSRHYLGWYVHVRFLRGVACINKEELVKLRKIRFTPAQEAFNATMRGKP